MPKVDQQLDSLRRLASDEGLEVAEELSDDGISAYSGKIRPAFLSLIEGIDAGRFDVILAVADDRLARNDEEGFILRTKCVAAGVRWHTLANGKTDPATAQGALMAQLNSALAQYESAIKAERLRRSVEKRLGEGKDLGGPRPFGFEVDRLTIREPEARMLRAAYDSILDGRSIRSIARDWTASPIQPDPRKGKEAQRHTGWRTQTVRGILMNPRNAGRLVVKGITYADDRPAIVDADTFEQVVAALSDPSRRPNRGPVPTTSAALGVVTCSVCGSRLTSTGTREGGTALRCAREGAPTEPGSRHATISLPHMEAQLEEAAGARALAIAHDATLDVDRAELAAARIQVATLSEARDAQQTLIGQPGVNTALALKSIANLGAQIAEAQAAVDAALAGDERAAARALARDFIDQHDGWELVDGEAFRGPWAQFWRSLDMERRRRFLRGLFDSIELMPFGGAGRRWRLRIDGIDPHPTDTKEHEAW